MFFMPRPTYPSSTLHHVPASTLHFCYPAVLLRSVPTTRARLLPSLLTQWRAPVGAINVEPTVCYVR
jgi:hypothetical protein